jgi:hypothetical protein
MASSSMVFPREREVGGAFSVRLRKDIEVRLRSRRFYCEVQRGLCTRGHERCVCYMWEQPWPIAATGQAVGLLHGLGGGLGGHSSLQSGGVGWYTREESGSYVGGSEQGGRQARRQASYPNSDMELEDS